MTGEHDPETYRWWLRLQLGLALAGGVAWLVGAAADRDFFTGVGLGLLLGALALRLGRTAAPDAPGGRGDTGEGRDGEG